MHEHGDTPALLWQSGRRSRCEGRSPAWMTSDRGAEHGSFMFSLVQSQHTMLPWHMICIFS
jgi:hypothetical protein